MKSFSLIAATVALSLSCMVASASAATPVRRPNIVFILADDLGWADVSCYGAKDIRTPVIDRLAKDGVRFTQSYSNGTECSPTRTAFLTGRYQHRVGGLECAIGTGNVGRYDDAIRLAARDELGLPASEMTISRLLKNAGYATALFGKWHLGYNGDKFRPNVHGFDQALYCIGGGMDYFHHVEDPPTYHNALRLDGKPVQREGYFTTLIADEAVKWLGKRGGGNAGQPFFLYVPLTAPHSPFQAPDESSPKPLPAGSPRWNQGRAPAEVYARMIESMDQEIGRILAALQQQGMAENTLVFFTSDNGGTGSARPFGLRGIKGSTFEGGVRVPLIVRWPGVLPAGKEYTHPTVTFDVTASMARIAGVSAPSGRAFDGIDILQHVQAGTPPPARTLFWRGRRGDRTWRAVRDGALKFVSRQDGQQTEEWLFDVERDPAEANDLAMSCRDDVARLKKKLAAWEQEVRPVR